MNKEEKEEALTSRESGSGVHDISFPESQSKDCKQNGDESDSLINHALMDNSKLTTEKSSCDDIFLMTKFTVSTELDIATKFGHQHCHRVAEKEEAEAELDEVKKKEEQDEVQADKADEVEEFVL
ncbi:hypothetical protein AgCh_027085 [Apium graveolens]